MIQNKYGRKPIPTWIGNVLYDSKLEARMAIILHNNSLLFRPHQAFQVYDRTGKWFAYVVDFLFNRPYKFAGISQPIEAIEVKGIIRRKDINRIEALEYCHGVKTFIATQALIVMWEKEGLFWNRRE